MRAAIGLRLLLALTLLGWGQFGFGSTVTYWYPGGWSTSTDRYQTALAACQQGISVRTVHMNGSLDPHDGVSSPASCRNPNGYLGSVHKGTQDCQFGHDSVTLTCNASCDAPKQMVDGQCVTPPEPVNCTNKPNIFSAQECTYNEANKKFLCPDVISYQGCEYVTAPNGSSNCDISTSICVPRYAPSGDEAGIGVPECTEGTCSPVPSAPSEPGQAPENCVSNGSSTYCFKDQESGCGTFNGKEGCFQNESGCGTFNGTWGCYPINKDQRNCGYANGQQVCFDPKDPTKQIPSTSPDHPKNGGNADGNENNDPKAPGTVVAGPQDGDSGATNEAIEELGDDLGEKIDKTNSLLDDILSLLEGDGDDSGDSDGSPADAEAEGKLLGDAIADAINTTIEDVDQERDDEIQDILNSIPDEVVSWFGPEGSYVGLDFIKTILPAPVACSDYIVPFSLAGYVANIRLPVCALVPYKPILEWVIWCLTAIGVWRIGYSALRQEDAKAAKGGF